MATNGTDTLYALPFTTGFYRIAGITEGSWNVYFVANPLTGYQNYNINNVAVQKGVVTTVPTVTLIK